MFISFIKMHGAGNDFVVLDNRKGLIPIAELDMQKLADRQFGIGCDQIIILEEVRGQRSEVSKKTLSSPTPDPRPQTPEVFMRIINADGSEVASCGNASRCVGWLLFTEHENASNTVVTIETKAGIISATVHEDNSVTIDMGTPQLEWNTIPLSEEMDTLHLNIHEGNLRDPVAVSMGNPHAVFFVDEPYDINLSHAGPVLERNALFPERANISVARIESRNHITLRVWERGAGETLACGTAACATLVAAHRRGLTGRIATVDLPGGTLEIEWRESDNHVLMTGPIATSFVGTFDAGIYPK